MKLHLLFSSFVMIGLSLTACGSTGSTPPAPAQAQVVTTISGVLSGASANTLTLKAGKEVLTSAVADAGGHFTLPLPGKDKLGSVLKPLNKGLLGGIGCSGQLSSSDAAAQGYDVINLTTSDSLYLNATASKTLLSRSLNGRVYLYADRPTSVTGTLDCRALTGMPTSVPVNITVSEGWNVLGLSVNGSVGLGGLKISGRLSNSSAPVNDLTTWTDQNAIKAQLSL
ncbi:hypothetical protein DKM44_10445 [Deinococcus irradiatisoli]|uniref:Carboxypeptidase regulatory-like domain-containing protein n=1 Tax=Deinococcus irradiatisoli TaxID=2202254 RepID=A0A2Z3JEH6_9DEIO|nr:hypothetical protein [Deinococcus irradiatisoli]AWN23597.1 hypothetical protein DKM44_10445 [Deinococcus irradiatisoli]